jgi:hypothetical protein
VHPTIIRPCSRWTAPGLLTASRGTGRATGLRAQGKPGCGVIGQGPILLGMSSVVLRSAFSPRICGVSTVWVAVAPMHVDGAEAGKLPALTWCFSGRLSMRNQQRDRVDLKSDRADGRSEIRGRPSLFGNWER